MADPTPQEMIILEMLGPELMTAVLGARTTCTDNTIMARIYEAKVHVERGAPAEVIGEDMSIPEAVAYLGGLT